MYSRSGQNLLHFQQTLLGLRHQRAVGELQNHLAIFFLGAPGVRGIAVRLLHLAEVDVGDLHLRFRRFRHVGEEGDEVLVLALRLRQGGSAAFLVPGVADGQLGAGNILGIGIGVDQRLQAEARDVVFAVLHRVIGAIEQAPCPAAWSRRWRSGSGLLALLPFSCCCWRAALCGTGV